MKNIILFIFIFLLFGCGMKMDPTLEDYLQPEPAQNLSLKAFWDKVLVSWSYPEKNKAKLSSFLLERENNGKIKSLGFFSPETTSFEDKDFTFGQIYKYRIFAINKKGIYSKAIEDEITPKKMPQVENAQYKITDDGVLLSWKKDLVMYNIYRINEKGEKIKRCSTEKNFFLDEIYSIEASEHIKYLITSYVLENSTYIEGKATEIIIPLSSFIPSEPEEVFWTINENGVYISWKEVPQRWIKGYKIYRKTSTDFVFIEDSITPLFFDVEYNINNLKSAIYYRICSFGPLKESNPVEIKVEVVDE